jgi:hypothetical protein
VWKVLGGAVLVIAGVAAFIEADAHKPEVLLGTAQQARRAARAERLGLPVPETGLSHTAYDLLRIGAWAFVIIGGLLVVMGLIRYWRTQGS